MTKISASILVILALFAFVSAEQFQRINFDQGRLRLRTLDTASSLKSFAYKNYTNITAVNVNLGDDYIKKAEIDITKTPTDMMITLCGSTTAFCSDCNEFTKFKCENNDCAYDTTKPLQTANPFLYIQRGYPFTLNVTIGSDANSWQLKNSAVLMTSGWISRNSYSYPGPVSSPNYIDWQSSTTYGFIGMGIDGDSAKNFVGDHPLFSVTTNGSGSGQLIFGNDTTKIGSSSLSQKINTDTNWTMSCQNISIGPNMTTVSSTTKLIFDLNYPGLGLPNNLYTSMITKMQTQYKLEYNYTTFGNSQFPYIYKGDLAKLGSITFGLTNNQNLTIAPQAYTRKLADGIYAILLQAAPYINSNVYTQTSSSEWLYYGVIGWSVMSNYYTVFEKTATSEPTIGLYPTYATSSNSGNTTTTTTSSWKTVLIIIVVVLVALVVISMALKKKNSLTKSDLGVELRAARV